MSFNRSVLVAAALLLALAFVPHLPGAFVWDDVFLIEHNSALLDPHGFVQLLTKDLWGQATGVSRQVYRALPMLSIWLQVQVFGLQLIALRLGNIALHALVVWLFVCWLERRGLARVFALGAGLLVLLHPSVCEPVMWISGRHDTLAMAACLGALLLWPSYTPLRALASGCALAAAFLSKEPYLIAAPLLALQAVLLQPPATQLRRLHALAQFGLALLPLTAAMLWRHQLGISMESVQLQASGLEHARNYASIVWHYGSQLLDVTNGATFAPFVPLRAVAAFGVWVGMLAVSGALVWATQRQRAGYALPLFGWAFFLLALSPHVISVPSIGFYGNRYAYCALFGLTACVAGLCARVPRSSARNVVLVRSALLLMALALAMRTSSEAAHWRDNITLYAADVSRDPDNGYALYHYGTALLSRSGCREALPWFLRASELLPSYERPFHNVSGCLIDLRQAARALPYAQRSVELAPSNSRAHYNLAIAQLANQRRSEALVEIRHALQLDPAYAAAAHALQELSARDSAASGRLP